MKRAKVFVDGILAGELQEIERGKKYIFKYFENYEGSSVSLEMPLTKATYEYDRFPPFFEGLLPEGIMLEGLLRQTKIDRNDLSRVDFIDYFGKERLGLSEAVIRKEIQNFEKNLIPWMEILESSFLSNVMRVRYKALLDERWARLIA